MSNNNNLQDDTFEAYLRLALTELANEENKDIMEEYSKTDITLPKDYSKKIDRFVKKASMMHALSGFFKFAQKAASILLTILGLFFVLFLSSKNVRASCQEYVMRIYDQFISISYNKDLSAKEEIHDNLYLPAGYSLVDSYTTDTMEFCYYESDSDSIEIYRSSQANAATFDNEHYKIQTYTLGKTEFTYYESMDEDFTNILSWHSDAWYYEIHSNLNKKELERIAKSMISL